MRKIELKISKLTLPSKNWPDFPMQDYNPSAIFATTPAVVLRECYISPDRGRVVEFYNANRMNI